MQMAVELILIRIQERLKQRKQKDQVGLILVHQQQQGLMLGMFLKDPRRLLLCLLVTHSNVLSIPNNS